MPPAPPSRFTRLAWLPVPLLAAGMGVLWAADLRTPYESAGVLKTLNFTFSTLASLAVALIVGRGFLARPAPGMLLLGCGVLVWGVGSIVAAAVGHGDRNIMVTIHNLCVWLGACGHLAGVGLAARPDLQAGDRSTQASRRLLRVAGAYSASLVLVALVAVVTLAG